MGRTIAISDIHGCPKTFLSLLEQLGLNRSDELYLLGDYFHRGPDSKGVIDAIWQLRDEGFTLHGLMGNHEQMLLQSIKAEQRVGFPGPGSRELLDNFGVSKYSEIPAAYINWVNSLDYYLELPGYFLVHAGLNFQLSDPLFDTVSMLWIRSWRHTIDRGWLGDRVIVHGHTPQPAEAIREQLDLLDHTPALCIDCGCAIGQAPYGQLCAFDLGNRELYFQKNVEEIQSFPTF